MKKRILIIILLTFITLLIISYNLKNYNEDMRQFNLYKKINKNVPNILENKKISKFIPKIIHQTSEDLNSYLNFEEEINLNKKINKNFVFKFYSSEDRINYIKSNYNDRILKSYLSISKDFGCCKADFFRYLVLYNEGGVYLDDKSLIVKKIDHLLENNNDKMLIFKKCWYQSFPILPPKFYYLKSKYNIYQGEFEQWFIASNAGNKMLKKIIEKIVYNIELETKNEKKIFKDKDGVLVLTGPVMFTETIIENDYQNCKIFNAFLNNHLKYKLKDHKKFSNGKHYSKHKNKYIIL